MTNGEKIRGEISDLKLAELIGNRGCLKCPILRRIENKKLYYEGCQGRYSKCYETLMDWFKQEAKDDEL